MLRTVFLALVGISSVTLAVGCKTSKIDTDNPSGSGGSGQGSGGFGGEPGTGGIGASSSTGGTSSTGGAGTGGASCVGEEGSKTIDSCNMMTITPDTAGGPSEPICGATFDQNPPGYDLCRRAVDIFTAGSFDFLQTCLAAIGTNPEACEDQPVAACVNAMFDAACALQFTADNCQSVADQCTTAGDTSFDVAKCKEDLKPFSIAAEGQQSGWGEMIECFNTSNNPGDCQTVWTDCYENQVFVF